MKYPITPEYLTSVPDPIIPLYTALETAVLKDICRRFRVSGEATESAIQQIKVLKRRGTDFSKIEEYIKKTLRISDREYDAIFERAVERNEPELERC